MIASYYIVMNNKEECAILSPATLPCYRFLRDDLDIVSFGQVHFDTGRATCYNSTPGNRSAADAVLVDKQILERD